MENRDYISYVFLPPRKEGLYKQNIFFLGYLEFVLHDINKGSLCWKKNCTFFHFVLMMTPSLSNFSLFCLFLLLVSSSSYLFSEICFPEIWLVFYMSHCSVTLTVISLSHFNKIYFLEWLNICLTAHILLGVL